MKSKTSEREFAGLFSLQKTVNSLNNINLYFKKEEIVMQHVKKVKKSVIFLMTLQ